MPAPTSQVDSSPRRTPRKWGRFALTAAFLYGIWILLSGRIYPQYLIIGAVGSILITLSVFPWNEKHSFPILRFLLFVPWHLWQVLISNLRVAKTALSPRTDIAPSFIRVAPGNQDGRALTVLGCAVTLTPGTLTVEIDPESMLIHSLDEASARDIEEGTMAQRVNKVFS